MKLRNKKTGKIVQLQVHHIAGKCYESLADVNKDWEDYEEPKEWYWFIEDNGVIQRSCHYEDLHPALDKARKEIGNYYDTKEEAEKAVEKLKAWKRLKDKGFRFKGVFEDFTIEFTAPKEEIGWYWCNGMGEDLDLLFGGEE